MIALSIDGHFDQHVSELENEIGRVIKYSRLVQADLFHLSTQADQDFLVHPED